MLQGSSPAALVLCIALNWQPAYADAGPSKPASLLVIGRHFVNTYVQPHEKQRDSSRSYCSLQQVGLALHQPLSQTRAFEAQSLQALPRLVKILLVLVFVLVAAPDQRVQGHHPGCAGRDGTSSNSGVQLGSCTLASIC